MSWSNALEPYISNPSKFYPHTVIYFDEQVTVIHDSFPKSKFHLLCLPRSKKLTKEHPTTALTDPIKDKLQYAIDWCIQYITDGFNKIYKCGPPVDEKFVQIGVHSVPSMNNLHIHILTKDFQSVRLKNKKHYNSFNTPFFISWDDLPLPKVPEKSITERENIKEHDLICCYCGENFTNKFSQLKNHLDIEFNKKFSKR